MNQSYIPVFRSLVEEHGGYSMVHGQLTTGRDAFAGLLGMSIRSGKEPPIPRLGTAVSVAQHFNRVPLGLYNGESRLPQRYGESVTQYLMRNWDHFWSGSDDALLQGEISLVHRNSLSNYRRGRGNPNLKVIEEITTKIGLGFAWAQPKQDGDLVSKLYHKDGGDVVIGGSIWQL